MWIVKIHHEVCVCIGIRNAKMCTCAIFGAPKCLSMHVCEFSQGDVCDVSNKYTLEVRVNNLGNEAALIVYGCIFRLNVLCKRMFVRK